MLKEGKLRLSVGSKNTYFISSFYVELRSKFLPLDCDWGKVPLAAIYSDWEGTRGNIEVTSVGHFVLSAQI